MAIDNKLKHLSIRKQKYTIGLMNSKTRYEAARQAGYSHSTAQQAKRCIETEDVKQAFQELMRRRIPAGKIVRRIREGMDAVTTEFFAKDGKVTDFRDVINWRERREYTAIAAQMGGYYTPKQEMDVTQRIDENTARRLAEISDKLNLAEMSTEELKALDSSHITIDMQEKTVERANSAYESAVKGGSFPISERVMIADKDE